jgi:hypothetical protein
MLRLLSSIVLALTLHGYAEGLPYDFGAGGNRPVPEGAKVTLELDKKERFLGENVLVHFVLENVGTEPFQFSQGGDYRGVGRHLRFKVTATNETGALVEETDPPVFFGGGFGGDVTLKPGEKWTESLPIMRYCRFEQAGRYTLRVTHDFGWKEADRRRPFGEIVIELKMPDAAEAETVVAAMEALPEGRNNSVGQRSAEYADFTCLRQAAYLKPLTRRLEEGNLRALSGLSEIEIPVATRALIASAVHGSVIVAVQIVPRLLERMPLSAEQSRRASEPGWEFLKSRKRKVEHAWLDEMSPGIRELAKVLMMRDPGLVGPGARLLSEVGTPDDSSVLIAALKPLLESADQPRHSADDRLESPEPLASISSAASALRGRGWKLPDTLNGNAEILLYLWQLADERIPRSSRSAEILDAFFVTSHWQMREAAVLALPAELDERWLSKLSQALRDEDYGVVRSACRVTGKSGHREFAESLVNIVAAENNRALVLAASEAAESLGAGGPLLAAWADRLSDSSLWSDALDFLQQRTVAWDHGWGGRTDLTREERLELRGHWRTFLEQHGATIAAGKRYAIGDPAITPGMFGRARQFTLPNGAKWPADSPAGQ